MEDKRRVFGNNLQYYLNEKKLGMEEFAESLGYSLYEIQKIIYARLFPDRQEQEQIAEALGLPVDTLYEALPDEAYERVGCFECRGRFSSAERKKEVFDLFDVYCDIQETLAEEGLKPSDYL